MGRRDWCLLGAIVVAGGLLRFLTLGHQSYDHDEAVTASRVLHANLGATMHVVGGGERSPPLYYLAAWLWSKLFGTGEVGLRSLSALAGTLTIPVAYRAAVVFGSRRAGLIAAALVAFNPFLLWYSQEARSYAFLVFFSAVALVYFAESLREPTPRSLGLWAAASGLALCSHYFAVFAIAPQAVWLLTQRSRRPRGTLAAVAVVGLVGLALAPFALHQEGSGRRNEFTNRSVVSRAGESALNYVASEEPGAFAGTGAIDAVQGLAAAGGALLLIGSILFAARSPLAVERFGALALGSVGAAALLVPVVLAYIGLDFLDPRNTIAAEVPLLLVMAVGCGATGAGRLGLLAALLGVVMFAAVDLAVYRSPQMQRPDWRGAAAAIGPSEVPRLIVAPANGNQGLVYYLGATRVRGKSDVPKGLREVDVLSAGAAGNPPRHGLREIARVPAPRPFVLDKYRSRRPVTVSPVRLSEYVLNESPTLVATTP